MITLGWVSNTEDPPANGGMRVSNATNSAIPLFPSGSAARGAGFDWMQRKTTGQQGMAGAFKCERNRCVPLDQKAAEFTMLLNRLLGITRSVSDGLDMSHVHAINLRIMSGEIMFTRPLHQPKDVARYGVTITRGLTQNYAKMRPQGLGGAWLGEVSASPRRFAKTIQHGLNAAGFYSGPIDGYLGGRTLQSINKYLVATQRPKMNHGQVIRNLASLAEELEVSQFAFEGLGQTLQKDLEKTEAYKSGRMSVEVKKGDGGAFFVPAADRSKPMMTLAEMAKQRAAQQAAASAPKMLPAPKVSAPTRKLSVSVSRTQIKALQNALRSAKMTDERGKPVEADSAWGGHTLAAVNNWRSMQGLKLLTKGEIFDSIDFLTSSIANSATPSAPKAAPAAPMPVATSAGALVSKRAVIALQQALQTAKIPDESGNRVKDDGAFGGHTLAAVNNWRAMQRLSTLTKQAIFDSMGPLTAAIAASVGAPTPAGAGAQVQAGARIPSSEKIKLLQGTLRAVGIKDGRGLPPIVNGKFGPNTLAAVNNWMAAQRRNPLTAGEVLASIDDLIASMRTTAPTVDRGQTPTAETRPIPTPETYQTVGRLVGGFFCKPTPIGTICKAQIAGVKQKVKQLQTLLNTFPGYIVRSYPRGKKIAIDGDIGPGTVEALKTVMMNSIARKRASAAPQLSDVALPEMAVEQITAEGIASRLDLVIRQVAEEVPLQKQVEAQSVGGKTIAAPNWTVTTKGNIVGNNTFRCLVMALQVQLNRFGQRLTVEGTIGPNTTSSTNKILGSNLTARSVASNLEDIVRRVKDIGDKQGLPQPPEDVAGRAFAKCALEVTQPASDSRVTTAGQVVTQPTLPPPVTPEPTDMQPMPSEPKPPVGIDPNNVPAAPASPQGPVVATVPGGGPEELPQTPGGPEAPPEEQLPEEQQKVMEEAGLIPTEGRGPLWGIPMWGWALIAVGSVGGIGLLLMPGKSKTKYRHRKARAPQRRRAYARR